MKKTLLFLADGFEEIEALATVDILRRGEIDVTTVSINTGKEVTGAHGVTVIADVVLQDVLNEDAEMLILPGGMPGAKNLGECILLVDMLKKHFEKNGLISAICAAPALVLSQLPLKPEIKLTCYPGFESYLSKFQVSNDSLVIDGNITTAKSPGFAFDFGLAIVERLKGKEKAKEVAAGMLLV
ncbi:MAG: DJ-1/PfpI family protein [Odoribacter sp.]|nr:DJ-1/PfpI family protein [Odoribacter sp.]